MRTPASRLRDLADLWESRQESYGDSVPVAAKILCAMLEADGQSIDLEAAKRLIIMGQMSVKLARYAYNASRGGHQDSLDDLAVYAQMLAANDEGGDNER